MKLLHKEEPPIVHRDLNISNLLLREDISTWQGDNLSDLILISDFSPVGHPRYRAPELFDIDAVFTTQVTLQKQPNKYPIPMVIMITQADVFSFGAVLYELLEGKPLYEGLDDREVVERICAGDYPSVAEGVPAVLHYLMVECWNVEPAKRPSFKAICRKLRSVLMSVVATGKPFCTKYFTVFYNLFLVEEEEAPWQAGWRWKVAHPSRLKDQ